MQWLRLTAVGTHFAVAMGIGAWIGYYWLDPLFGTAPFFTAFLAVCGIGAGFLNLFRELEILNKKDKEAQAVDEPSDEQTPL